MSASEPCSTVTGCIMIPIPRYKHSAVAAGLNIQQEAPKLKSCRESFKDINQPQEEIIHTITHPEVGILSERHTEEKKSLFKVKPNPQPNCLRITKPVSRPQISKLNGCRITQVSIISSEPPQVTKALRPYYSLYSTRMLVDARASHLNHELITISLCLLIHNTSQQWCIRE